MKFKCNGSEWEIKEVDEATINNEMKQDGTLGVTIYKTQEILLLKDQANIIKTLKHELMHVWLYEYGHNQDDENKFSYEGVCEIVASSNDFINEVISNYLLPKRVEEAASMIREHQEHILDIVTVKEAMKMNINQNINKLLYALKQKGQIYKINSFQFYSEKNNKYSTKYQILRKTTEEVWNLEKDEPEYIERYKQDYECYSKVDLMKYLIEEYRQGSEADGR